MIVRGFDERRIRKQKLENIKQSHAGSERKPYFLHLIFSYVFAPPGAAYSSSKVPWWRIFWQ